MVCLSFKTFFYEHTLMTVPRTGSCTDPGCPLLACRNLQPLVFSKTMTAVKEAEAKISQNGNNNQ